MEFSKKTGGFDNFGNLRYNRYKIRKACKERRLGSAFVRKEYRKGTDDV